MKEYKAVNDFVLFGSAARGDSEQDDIDVAAILKDDSILANLQTRMRQLSEKIHFNWLMLDGLFDSSLFPTLLEEGFSVRQNTYLYEYIGYSAYFYFNYDISHLTPSKKVLFSYALHGQKERGGILKQLKGERFGKGTVTIPLKYAKEFRDFLELWNANYRAKRALVK